MSERYYTDFISQKAQKVALGIPYETQNGPPNARTIVLSVIQTKVTSFNLWSGHRVALGVLRDFCNPEKLKWVNVSSLDKKVYNTVQNTVYHLRDLYMPHITPVRPGVTRGLLCLPNLLSKLKVDNVCLNPRVVQKNPRLELDMSGDLHNAISLQEVWRPRYHDVPDDMNMTPNQRRELERQPVHARIQVVQVRQFERTYVLLLLVRMMMIGCKSALAYFALYCVVFIKNNKIKCKLILMILLFTDKYLCLWS